MKRKILRHGPLRPGNVVTAVSAMPCMHDGSVISEGLYARNGDYCCSSGLRGLYTVRSCRNKDDYMEQQNIRFGERGRGEG